MNNNIAAPNPPAGLPRHTARNPGPQPLKRAGVAA
jgi:hypothetical protein